MIRKVGSDITQSGTVTKYVSEFPASAVIFELLISRAPAPLGGEAATFLVFFPSGETFSAIKSKKVLRLQSGHMVRALLPLNKDSRGLFPSNWQVTDKCGI